jgi:hypothetical protein
MTEPATVKAYRKNDTVCVDLRPAPHLAKPRSKSWRKLAARRLRPCRVLYGLADGYVSEDDAGKEVFRPSPVLAGRWSNADEFYTPSGLEDLIKRKNKDAQQLLVAQMHSRMGIVPFVGAGMSVEFGFPGWPKFLTDAAGVHSHPAKVLTMVQAGKYIDAASSLYLESADRFQRLVENAFGREVGYEEVRRGAMAVLPLIAKGPVITTNFDRVLETAFAAAGKPFTDVITAAEADNVIRTMHRDQHVLIKMHGDALDRSARVFTGLEYARRYARSRRRKSPTEPGIPQLARMMFTNRPLLFLGSSLDRDRTLEVLEAIHKELPGLTHYAILAGSYSVTETRERQKELDDYGISPLWFVPGDFARIAAILEELQQEASTRLLWSSPPNRNKRAARSIKPRPPVAGTSYRPQTPHIDKDRFGPLISSLARRIVGDRVAFFLGAGAHLTPKLSAARFYRSLAEKYAVEPEIHRADVAQFIVDHEGKAEMWEQAKELLGTDDLEPSPVYRFLVDLPSLINPAGVGGMRRLWFLTTNYDVLLERALSDSGQPFHWLYYQVDGKFAGRFVHRDPEGQIRLILRPRQIHCFSGDTAHVVVKLDGGIRWDEHVPETVAISPVDFTTSYLRLPTALPEAVRNVIEDRSLLILGSSLRDVHVQGLVRWSAGPQRRVKTWAVMALPSPHEVQSWANLGVEVIDCDLKQFIDGLKAAISQLRPERVTGSSPI